MDQQLTKEGLMILSVVLGLRHRQSESAFFTLLYYSFSFFFFADYLHKSGILYRDLKVSESICLNSLHI